MKNYIAIIPVQLSEQGEGMSGKRRERIRQESLPYLPQITFAIFSLKGKHMFEAYGEARMVVLGLAYRAVQWLLGAGTS